MFSAANDKLTPEQELIVRRNVNPKFFNVDGILEYLKENDIINFDIFTKNCTKKVSYSYLRCFKPVSRDVFINRLEIYFYDLKDNRSSDMLLYFVNYLQYEKLLDEDIYPGMPYQEDAIFKAEYDLEPAYQLLDKIISIYKIPLEKGFSYLRDYFGDELEYKRVRQWVSYLELLDEPNETNVFPKNFYYSFNIEMQKKGQTPRLVMVSRCAEPTFDKENKCQYVELSGYFPLDENEKLVEEWTAVWFEKIDGYELGTPGTIIDEEDLFMFHDFDGEGMITIKVKVNPESRIFALKRRKGPDGFVHNYWVQVYAGSCVTKFSFKPISDRREELKLSQKEIADLADINVRSYQRMEAGESTPDALALISLMGILDIRSPSVFKKQSKFMDDDYTKFRSGKAPSEFLEDDD